MDFKLEICVDSVESAIIAQNAGADRIELCDNLIEGGTTPSYGTISSARDNIDISIHVIIRPRGSDFFYSDSEFDVMRRDIEVCGELGIDGIVIGILREDGSIDKDRCARLIDIASPMSVTFHRAFDLCADPLKGLHDLISIGAARVLTSGQKNKAAEGTELIKSLVKQAGTKIVVMPGSGLDETNIEAVARATGAAEFHLTGRKVIESEMKFRREGIQMGGYPGLPEYSRRITDPDRVKKIITILKMI